MQDGKRDAALGSPIRLRKYIATLTIFWTIAIAIVLTWELLDERDQVLTEARSEAWGIWQKEDAIYRWAALRGKLYVPATESLRPDPQLANVPDRDITTPAGTKLTLVSPATIMRQAYAPGTDPLVHQGRVTSLRPINPQNKPDAWEENALRAFAAGQREFSSEETIDGKRYLRLMRPLVIEAACLNCHVEQDRKVGEIRGGFSVAVPMTPVWAEHMPDIIHRIIGYGGMWLLGMLGITVLSRRLHRQMLGRYAAERKVQEANELLEQRVAGRTAELAKANNDLQSEVADRRQAEQWLLESEQRFRGYFEQGLVGMAILSANKEWVEVNERFCRMLGYTEDELLLKTWEELTHPDDLPAEDAQFKQLVAGNARGFVIDRRFVRKDGKAFHVGLSAQCLRKADGTVDHILILVQDTPQTAQG
jgi:PAS domain S-box-containing protein